MRTLGIYFALRRRRVITTALSVCISRSGLALSPVATEDPAPGPGGGTVGEGPGPPPSPLTDSASRDRRGAGESTETSLTRRTHRSICQALWHTSRSCLALTHMANTPSIEPGGLQSHLSLVGTRVDMSLGGDRFGEGQGRGAGDLTVLEAEAGGGQLRPHDGGWLRADRALGGGLDLVWHEIPVRSLG